MEYPAPAEMSCILTCVCTFLCENHQKILFSFQWNHYVSALLSLSNKVIRNLQEQMKCIYYHVAKWDKRETGLCLQLYFPDLANFAISSNVRAPLCVSKIDQCFLVSHLSK